MICLSSIFISYIDFLLCANFKKPKCTMQFIYPKNYIFYLSKDTSEFIFLKRFLALPCWLPYSAKYILDDITEASMDIPKQRYCSWHFQSLYISSSQIISFFHLTLQIPWSHAKKKKNEEHGLMCKYF